MNRRDFLANTCGACLALTGISTLLPACNPTRYLAGNLGADGITIRKSDFASKQSYVIVRNEALQYPIYVYHFGEENYTAVWMRCSHQGSELHATGDSLQCPAHGSEFNNRGHVTNGPADANLKTFPVTVQHEELFIDLRKK